jgi:hypothetical protein
MRTRDLVLLCTAAALAVAVAVPMLSESHAGEVAPPAPAMPSDEAARVPILQPVDGGPAPRANPEPAVFHPTDGVGTTGWTKGVIRGDIALAVSVLGKVQVLQVVVDELRPLDNKEHKTPFHVIKRVPLGVGTPTFEVRDVDFSPYGYVVAAYAPGTNGNQVTVQVTEQKPLVDDVRLAITAAAPFSLLLRDQESLAVTATDVCMVPIGPPLGRPPLNSVSDNYGSAVFESALAGDYMVHVGPAHAPLIEPQRITVPAGGYKLDASGVQPQGQTLVVPRGVPLSVLCTDPYHNPLEGVAVRLEATDRKVRTEVEGVTDPRGRCEFPRVLGGVWQIDATKPGYETRSRQITIDPKQPPAEQQLQMPRRL